jgi:UPF0755 protein
VSDEFGKGGIPPGGDPLFDPNDPAAVEREERRREREAKRAQKKGKKVQKDPPPLAAPKPPPPPAAPRTPEQEFWDEPAEPTPPPPGAEPSGKAPADGEKPERGRRGLLRRRKGKAAAAGAASAAAAGGAAAASGATPPAPPTGETPTAPPTGESPRPQPPAAPATGEQPVAPNAGPPTTEQPVPSQSGPPTTEQPMVASGPPTTEQPIPGQAAPPTAESPRPGAEPTTGETAVPPQTEAPHAATAEAPRADPGPRTAETPRPDPNQPTGEEPRPGSEQAPATGEQATVAPVTGEQAIPPLSEAQHGPTAAAPRVDPRDATADGPRPDPNQPTGENIVPGAGPSTREHRALPPRPMEETGAGDWEPPPPRDDDDWFGDDEPFDDEGDPRMAGAARTGRRHADEGRRRFGGPLGPFLRHPFRVLGVVILIVILLFANALFQPFHGDGSGKVVVKIPKGSSVGEVGELLEKKGVISSGFIIDGSTYFQARVSLSGDRSNLIAGKHVMQKDMSYGDAISALTTEPSAATTNPTTVTVTIPEGYTRTQIAQLAKEDGLRGSYMKATKKSKYLDPAEYGGKKAKDLEGFLFPDTWELKRHRPVKELVQLQLQDFKKKIKSVNMKYAKSKNLTVYDVVTIASIIEHEAGVPSQRKQVAEVIYNRLREGMTLGSDATVRFAVHNYTKPLTQSQLESNSPYNTRVHAGLPPGPISNPGIATINAAAHPSKGKNLFFVTSPDCKKLAFSKTEAEFEQDVQKYEASKCTEA